MNRQEQIKEMMRVMDDGCLAIVDCEDSDITCAECRATLLYEAGYRKISKDKKKSLKEKKE